MSTYIQNLKQSFTYMAKDMLEDYVPQTKSVTEGIGKLVSVFRKNNGGNARAAVRNIVNSLPFYKESMGLVKGIYSNITTGRIYAEGGFDMNGETMDFQLNHETSNPMIMSEGDDGPTALIDDNNREGSFSNDSKLITKSVMDSSRASTKVLTNVMTKNHADTMFFLTGMRKGTEERMDSMTSYLKSVSEFNNTAMRTYIDNSIKYYNDSMSVLNDIKKGMHGSNKYFEAMGQEMSLKDKINKKGLMAASGDIGSRLLNSATYGMGSMIPAIIGMTLQMMTPMFLAKSLAGGALNKMFKLNGLKDFTNKLGIGDVFDATVKGAMFSKNSKISRGAEALNTGSSINKDLKMRDFKNEAAGFSTQSDRTLNIVIPGYLSKILVAIEKKGSDDEQYFDYTRNQWKTRGSMTKDLKRNIDDATFMGASRSVGGAIKAGLHKDYAISNGPLFDAFCMLLTKGMVGRNIKLSQLSAITDSKEARLNIQNLLGVDESDPIYDGLFGSQALYVSFINAITEGKNKNPQLFAKVDRELRDANGRAQAIYDRIARDKYLTGDIHSLIGGDIDLNNDPDEVKARELKNTKVSKGQYAIKYIGKDNKATKTAADVYNNQGLSGMFQSYASGLLTENEFFKQFSKTKWGEKILGGDNFKFDVASKGGVGKLFGELQARAINNMERAYESVTGKKVNKDAMAKITNIAKSKFKGIEEQFAKLEDSDLSPEDKKKKQEELIKNGMPAVVKDFSTMLKGDKTAVASATGSAGGTDATDSGLPSGGNEPAAKKGIGEKIGKYALAGFGGLLGVKALGGLVKSIPVLGPGLAHFGLLSPVFLGAVGIGAGILAAKSGIIGKLIGDDKAENKSTTGSFKNRFMNGIAAAVGVVGAGSLISKLPFMGGIGGLIQSPLLVATAAVASGIFLERDNIKKKLFGDDSEKNTFMGNIGVLLFGDKENNKKKSGILSDVFNKFRDKIDKTSDKIQNWFKENISENIRTALSPLGKIFLSIGGFLKAGLKKLFGFKDTPKEEKEQTEEEKKLKEKYDKEQSLKDDLRTKQKKIEENGPTGIRGGKDGVFGQGGRRRVGLFGQGGKDFFYKQDNSIWGGLKLADSSVSQSGCAIACAAMALASLKNDKDITPKALVRLAEEHKLAKDGIDTQFFKSLEKGFGVIVNTTNADNVNEDSIITTLKKGGKVIVMVDVNYNGVARHYLYVKGYKGNMVIISDPNGEANITMHKQELHSYAINYTTIFNDPSAKGKDISNATKPKGKSKLKQWLGWEEPEEGADKNVTGKPTKGGLFGGGGKIDVSLSKGTAKQNKLLFLINHNIKSGLNGVAYNLEYIKRLMIKSGAGKLDANEDPRDGAFGFGYKMKQFKGILGRAGDAVGRGIGWLGGKAKDFGGWLGRGIGGSVSFLGKKVGAPMLEGAGKGIGGLLNFAGKMLLYPMEWFNKTFEGLHKRLGKFIDVMSKAGLTLIKDLYGGAKWILQQGAKATVAIGGAVGGLLIRGGVGAADALGKSKLFENLAGFASGALKMLRIDKLFAPLGALGGVLGKGLGGISKSLFGPKKVFVEGGRLDSVGHINTITAIGAVDMDAYKAVKAANKDVEKGNDKSKDINKTGGQNVTKINNQVVNENTIKALKDQDSDQDNINKGWLGMFGKKSAKGTKNPSSNVVPASKGGGFNILDFLGKKGGLLAKIAPFAAGALGLFKNAGMLARGAFGGIAGVGGFAADALANIVSMIPGLRDTGFGKSVIGMGKAGGNASKNFVRGADNMIADVTGSRHLNDKRTEAHRDRMGYVFANKGLQAFAKKSLGKLVKGPLETAILKGMYANEAAAVKKVAGKLTKDTAVKLLSKEGIEAALKKLFENGSIKKIFAKAGVALGEKSIGKLAEKAAKGVGTKMAMILARGFTSMVPLAGIVIQAAFFAGDLAFGMAKAGEIFGIMDEDVTMKHRIVAGLVHAIQGLVASATPFLFVVALIPEDFLVDWAWKSMSTEEELATLEIQRGKKLENDKKVAELNKTKALKQTFLEKVFNDTSRVNAAAVANGLGGDNRLKLRDDVLDKKTINRDKAELKKIAMNRATDVEAMATNKFGNSTSKAAQEFIKNTNKNFNNTNKSGWFGTINMRGGGVPRSPLTGGVSVDQITDRTKQAQALGDTAKDKGYTSTIMYQKANLRIGAYSYTDIGCGPFAMREIYASMGDRRYDMVDAIRVADFYNSTLTGVSDADGMSFSVLANYMVYDGYKVYYTTPAVLANSGVGAVSALADLVSKGAKVILLQHPNDPDLMHYTAIIGMAYDSSKQAKFLLYDNLFGGARWVGLEHASITDAQYLIVSKTPISTKGMIDYFYLNDGADKVIAANPDFDYNKLGKFADPKNIDRFFEAKAYAAANRGKGTDQRDVAGFGVFDTYATTLATKYKYSGDKAVLRKMLIKDFFNNAGNDGNSLAVSFDKSKKASFKFADSMGRMYDSGKWANITTGGFEYVGKSNLYDNYGNEARGRSNATSGGGDKATYQNVNFEGLTGRGLKIKPGSYLNSSKADSLKLLNDKLTNIAAMQSGTMDMVANSGTVVDNSISEGYLGDINDKLQIMIELLAKNVTVSSQSQTPSSPQIDEHFMSRIKAAVRG